MFKHQSLHDPLREDHDVQLEPLVVIIAIVGDCL
jgi:hypothetical protein